MIRRFLLLLLVFPVILLTGCIAQQEPVEQEQVEQVKKEVRIQANEPDAGQIQADLIGSYLKWHDEDIWYFAALSEFDNVTINNKTSKGNAIEYDVTMLLKDFDLERYFILDVFLVYKNVDTRWQLYTYLVTDFREMATQTH